MNQQHYPCKHAFRRIRHAFIKLLACLVLLLTVQQPGFVLAEDLPTSAMIPGFAGHAQSHSLSCEARSAVDWMAFWGVYVTEAEFLSRLPASDNPDEGFVGNVDDLWGNIPPQSYGVHARPIAALLREYGFEAEARRGISWDEVRSEIAAGRPVIIWVIGQMWRGIPQSYTSTDGSTTTVARFEHTMVLTGYDPSYVYVVDAFSGQAQAFSVDAFLRSWEVLDKMAVTGQREPSSPPPEEEDVPATEVQGSTYIVQRGDYLVALAQQFGVTWQELAEVNRIKYPFVIYPGQSLIIPGASEPEQVEPEDQPDEPPASISQPSPTTAETLPTATPETTSLLTARDPEEMVHKAFLPAVDYMSETHLLKPHGMARQIFRKQKTPP